MRQRQVVVTGLGVISPAGLNQRDFLRSLREGVSGEGPISSFDVSDFPVRRAFEVKNFDSRKFGTHILDPFIQYAVAAAAEAFEDAGFLSAQVDPYRVGISVSSSKGGVHTIDRFQERFLLHPSAILGARIYSNAVPNFAAQWIARRWKIKGPAKCYIAACATGTTAVIEGARMVQDGTVDYCLAGASDASIVPLMLAGYRKMKVLSPAGIYPFDRRRRGFLVGEGAGIVLIETLDSAKARGAKVYAEIAGAEYGINISHPIHYSDDEGALSHTLARLFKKSGLCSADIDYVNLHGTATQTGDIYETREIKKAFGKNALQVPMSSTKAITGHMLGASGAVEIIACLLAIKEGFVPATLGLEDPDPECDLDYIPKLSRPKRVRIALSHSMGFGGQIAAILLRRSGG